MTRAVLFDLDGTLVDTLHDIADAMNKVLEAAGLPVLPIADYREHVGWGARDLVERALPESEQGNVDTHLQAFRERYYDHPVHSSALYPGIGELLAELEARDVPMAILTNKPEKPALVVVEALLADVPFRFVRGAREGVPRKPDPTALIDLANAMGIAPTDCLYLGDTEVDVQAAESAAMTPVGVTWGFRPESVQSAPHVLQSPSDLLPLI